MKKSTLLLIVAATVITVALRLINQPFLNFSAMGALAVLCGAAVRPVWLAVTIPLAARLLTDCVLQTRTGHGFYGSIVFDYAAYAAIAGIGYFLQPRQILTAAFSGLLAAITFFVVSNLGVWCMPHDGSYLYPRTLAGLADCFKMGLPFANGTFAGEIGFSVIFFGALQLMGILLPSEKEDAVVSSAVSEVA